MARDNTDVMLGGKAGTTTFLCYTGNCLGIDLPQCLTVFLNVTNCQALTNADFFFEGGGRNHPVNCSAFLCVRPSNNSALKGT